MIDKVYLDSRPESPSLATTKKSYIIRCCELRQVYAPRQPSLSGPQPSTFHKRRGMKSIWQGMTLIVLKTRDVFK